MRFFIIPKRMFKNSRNEEKSKQPLSKKKKRIAAVSALLVVLLFAGWMVYALCRVPSRSYCEAVGQYSLCAANEEEREAFFEQFGYKARQVESCEILIPSASSEFEQYNELQKSQGLDLTPYCAKKAMMYTMSIEGKETAQTELFGVIIVYKDKVVAGHITDNLYPACVMSFAGG